MLFNYIVLRVDNLEKSKNFYNILRLNLVQEQHDNGVIHYSCNINGIILELYPATLQYPAESSIRLGLKVEKILQICEDLKINNISFTILKDKSIILDDPDGRKIHLLY